MSEKLQKILAHAGVGSRRQMEQWISEGRIKVNGVVASLGDRAEPHDVILVDNLPLNTENVQLKWVMYHKPEGQICSRQDPDNRDSVFEHIPVLKTGRWVSIGRLDFNTTGLLLFTTDGELANRLMHPSSNIEREYAVRITGEVSPEILQNLRQGVELEDGMAQFLGVYDAGGTGRNHWYHVTLAEGRNREVRRLWESQGLSVSRLHRIRYGPLLLGRTLRKGKFRFLEETEINALYHAAGITVPDQHVKKRPSTRQRTYRRR